VFSPQQISQVARKVARPALLSALFVPLAQYPSAAGAQDPLLTLPNNYRSIFDNADVAVIRAHYGAHEKIPVHDHTAFATVFIYLNDAGQVRIDHAEDGKVESVVRPPTVTGAYRVAAGIAERHSIENLGDSSSDFLRVELKYVSLASLKEPFRGKAPSSLKQNQDATEFTAPGLQIERIVCVEASPCTVKPSPSPSLLVAFTPLEVASTPTGRKERVEAGAVRWVASSQGLAVTSGGAAPPHILRLILPQ
jgi:hypothetical protein